MKIKDEFALSVIAGLIACIPQLTFDTISYFAGYSKYFAFQIAAGIFVRKDLTTTPAGLIMGAMIWMIAAIFISLVTIAVFRFTGKDYWWLKSPAIVLSIMFIGIYGFLFNLGGAEIVPNDVPTNVTMLINNVIFSIVLGYSIIHYGADELIVTKKRNQ